jgi:hypothetical protein
MIEDDAARSDGPATRSTEPASAPRRRKHIYPPADQMAAEQSAASASRAPSQPTPTARRRKHIYPPADQMAAQRAAAASRAASSSAHVNGGTPVMAALDPEPGTFDDGTSVSADRMDIRAGAVGRVDAGEVTVTVGAIGATRADRVSVDKGALGAALAGNVEVSRGYARSILARQVQIDRAAARMIIAADVRAERTAVVFLLARRVSGDVRVLLDWRGALAFGAVAGLVGGLIARARRR